MLSLNLDSKAIVYKSKTTTVIGRLKKLASNH